MAGGSGTRRSRALGLALVIALGAGCTSDPAPGPPSSDARTEDRAGGAASKPARRLDPMLGIETGWGPSAAEIKQAVRIVRRMSTKQLAGQVIVTDYLGTAAPVERVRRLHLGGVILFDSNVASSKAVRSEMRTLRRAVKRPWPLWISADQEGGLVERLQHDLTRFPTFMSAGAADRPALARRAARASGRELAWLGLTADFAPVADVTAGPGDPTIGSRSASEFARRAATTVTAAARGYLDAGVVPVVKHFPGHGSAPADSHKVLPVVDRSRRRLRDIDLRPFRAAIEAGVPAVMVGHLDVRAYAPRRASSLARPIVNDLLRERLGFDGLVTTDALDMAAVTDRAGSAASAVRALAAGVDLLVMPPDPRAARDGILAAVRSGELRLERLRQAAARQGALMLHRQARAQAGEVSTPRPPGSARGASWALSRAAVTQVAGACGVRHIDERVLITGPGDDVAALSSAFRTLGVEVYVPPPAPEPEPPAQDGDRTPRRDRDRLPSPEASSEPSSKPSSKPSYVPPPIPAGTTRIAITGFRGGPVSGDVAVASDAPWALGASTAPVKIAAYGDTTGAMRAVAQVLLGREAPGRLPVRVGGVSKGC